QEITDAQMKSIKAPSLIIASDNDVVTPEHAVEMYRLLPQSKLAIFPGGHGEYIGELTMPQDSAVIAGTVSMIDNFLNDVEGKK
ncbi:MAG TPA: hypothetical protein VFV79_09540, partial [Saprospiraceae bacterium]|nr:hypothetical protein [Saprospiraceae bacterium]